MPWGARVGILGAAAALAAGVTAGFATTLPEERCIAAKARPVAAAIRATAECDARDLEAPGSVGPECFVDARSRLPHALERADRLGPCGGVHAYLTQHVIDCIPFLQNTPNRCGGNKIRAGAALAVRKLRCLARAAGGPVDLACFARAEARYQAAFARAERLGPCPGTIDYIAGNPEACIPLFAAAFLCGNGGIDAGEQCDGQLFCSSFGDCRIRRDIACCSLGAFCGDTIPEMCFAGGGQTERGTCIGTPCDFFPGCVIGTCQDPAIAPTTVCCQRTASCNGSSVATTFDLRDALLACVDAGGQPLLDVCGASGRCGN